MQFDFTLIGHHSPWLEYASHLNSDCIISNAGPNVDDLVWTPQFDMDLIDRNVSVTDSDNRRWSRTANSAFLQIPHYPLAPSPALLTSNLLERAHTRGQLRQVTMFDPYLKLQAINTPLLSNTHRRYPVNLNSRHYDRCLQDAAYIMVANIFRDLEATSIIAECVPGGTTGALWLQMLSINTKEVPQQGATIGTASAKHKIATLQHFIRNNFDSTQTPADKWHTDVGWHHLALTQTGDVYQIALFNLLSMLFGSGIRTQEWAKKKIWLSGGTQPLAVLNFWASAMRALDAHQTIEQAKECLTVVPSPWLYNSLTQEDAWGFWNPNGFKVTTSHLKNDLRLPNCEAYDAGYVLEGSGLGATLLMDQIPPKPVKARGLFAKPLPAFETDAIADASWLSPKFRRLRAHAQGTGALRPRAGACG